MRVLEAASDGQCKNNLRQVAIALHHFEGRHGTFPPGYETFLAVDGTELGPGWGWAAYLKDDIEQQNLPIDFNQDIRTSAARTLPVKLYRCPADRQVGVFTVSDENNQPLADVAHANYIAVNGIYPCNQYPGTNTGVFLRNRRIRVGEVADGLSNTMFVSERCTTIALATWTGAVPGGKVPFVPSGNPFDADEANSLVLGHTGPGPGDEEIHQPNGTDPTPDSFSSRHRGGVNFVFGDGSVRTITSAISPPVYVSLATRDGGELYSASDF
jgi:prepilin-type processing-associated H-X9-DG protein